MFASNLVCYEQTAHLFWSDVVYDHKGSTSQLQGASKLGLLFFFIIISLFLEGEERRQKKD